MAKANRYATVERLARDLGYSRTALNQWRYRGKPSAEGRFAIMICAAGRGIKLRPEDFRAPSTKKKRGDNGRKGARAG